MFIRVTGKKSKKNKKPVGGAATAVGSGNPERTVSGATETPVAGAGTLKAASAAEAISTSAGGGATNSKENVSNTIHV